MAGTFIDESGLELVGQQPGTRPVDQLRSSRLDGNGGYTNRPNVSGKVSYPKTQKEWFNTAQFSAPIPAWLGGPNQGFGNAGKDAIVGPGRVNFTTSLYKSFAITERAHFELRFESFNTFNHTEFNAFNNQLGASQFGQITSVRIRVTSNWAASSSSKFTLNRGAAGNSRRALFLWCARQGALTRRCKSSTHPARGSVS